MKSLNRFFSRLANLAFRRQNDDRLREEIEEHIALATEENIRAGMSPVESRRQARLKFGAVEAMKEDYRAQRGLPLIENLIHDLRFAFRLLAKSPGFAVVAVVTLALGIGANTVVFSVLNALELRPLNLPDPQSLYTIERAGDSVGNESYPNYLDLRDRNRSFDGLAAFAINGVGLDAGNNPSIAWALEVSTNYFDVLRVQPDLGRFFHGSDQRGPDSAPYIVLSHAYWHSYFQDDRTVVGRTVHVNNHPFTILGVAPPSFNGTIKVVNPDIFVPLVNQQQLDGRTFLNARDKGWLSVVGHLRQGVTRAQAIADLNSIGASLERAYPSLENRMRFSLGHPALSGDAIGGPIESFLSALMLLAVLILLAACANLGSLFAARAADRSREMALRLALGASRLRILRQVFTETVLVSLIGGAVGLLATTFLMNWLSAWHPLPRYPLQAFVNPDVRVYVLAWLLAVASGFLFGAVPVRQVLRIDPYGIVKSGSLASPGRRITARDILLAVQIALSAVLVTSSLVAVRGLIRSLHSDLGFNPNDAIVADIDLNMGGYSGEKLSVVQKRMIDSVAAIPGVQAVGLSDGLFLGDCCDRSAVFADSVANFASANAAAQAVTYRISPGYFQAAATPLLSGRAFTWQDRPDSPRIAVVNQTFARRVFGSASAALNNYYKLSDGTRVQIVGVAQDGKYDGINESPTAVMFFPLQQHSATETWMVVRSTRDPRALTADIRTTIAGIDPALPLYIETWHQAMDLALFVPRVASEALGVMGVMGALLSITGIFGLAAYSVSKRKRELGIRMALGARNKEVLQAALGRALKLLVFGSAAGLLLGILASRVLASIVFQATPRDPLVLAGVVVAMALLGLLATWVPAQRALSIDPAMLMREE